MPVDNTNPFASFPQKMGPDGQPMVQLPPDLAQQAIATQGQAAPADSQPAVPPTDPVANQDAIRAQLMASLSQRMQNQAVPDTAVAEAAAKDNEKQSNIIRSGVQLGQAFLGKQTNGDNLWSKSLEDDNKSNLAKAMAAKKEAEEANLRRETLRNQLSGKYVENDLNKGLAADKYAHENSLHADDNAAKLQMHQDTKRALDQKDRERQDLQEEKLLDKRALALKNDLDPNKNANGNLGKAQAMINSADRIETLFNRFPDGNIPAPQITELATATAAMVGGGSPQSQKQIDEIVPHSITGDASKLESWLTNEPHGTNQQKFLKLIRETAAAERETAQDQKYSAVIQRLPAHANLRTHNPEIYNQQLLAAGVDPEMIDEKGRYKKPTHSAESKTAQSAFPKQVTNAAGQVATVSNTAELKEAQAEGFK